MDGALTAIGSPEELASEYVTDSLLAGAEASRSPWRVLDGLFRWASLSVAGFLVLVTSMVGYFFGIVLMLCAALKALHPHTAGLWAIPNGGDVELSLRLGFGTPPTSGHELLGWRILPLGLVGGGALVVLTTRFALWCARQYRSSQRLPRR